MIGLSLAEAQEILAGAFAEASRLELKPVAVSVLDAGGHLIALARQDGATFLRSEISQAKAWTAVSLAAPSRAFAAMADARPQFVASLVSISQGRMAPAAGGVTIIREGAVIGAVGVSGDAPDNDEALAVAGVIAAGLTAGD